MTEVLERATEGDMTEFEAEVVHERRFGNQEILHLPLNSLIVLPQIRGGKNAIQDDLTESIDEEDLDNPINVARVTKHELQAYIDYTNRLWGGELSASQLSHLRQDDGKYNLVVAGHSRTSAVQTLAERHTARTGQQTDWTIQSKLLKDTSVRGIVKKQLTENMHKGAPIEREAVAVVEFYALGLGTEWHNLEEFQKAMKGQLKPSTIRAAVAFHSLPTQIRDKIEKKTLAYDSGVSLGKSADTMRKYYLVKAGFREGDDLDQETELLLEETVQDRLIRSANWITSRNMSCSNARIYIKNETNTMLKEVRDILGDEASAELKEMTFDELAMVDPKQELRNLRRRERSRREQLLREVGKNANARTVELINEFGIAEDPEGHIALLQDLEDAREQSRKEIQRRRRVGLALAENVLDLFDEEQAG